MRGEKRAGAVGMLFDPRVQAAGEFRIADSGTARSRGSGAVSGYGRYRSLLMGSTDESPKRRRLETLAAMEFGVGRTGTWRWSGREAGPKAITPE